MSSQQPDAAALRAEILAEVDAADAKIAAALDGHRSVLAEMAANADRIRSQHAAAAQAARAAFEAVPPVPDLPDGQPHVDAIHELMQARIRLAEERFAALEAALPRVVTAWQDARPHLDEQARAIALQAEELAAEYAGWWRLLHDARHAAERATSTHGRLNDGPSTRMPPRPTAGAVLDAAAGVDLCGVRPLWQQRNIVNGKIDNGSGRIMVGD